jgi:hypothetical protein
VKTAPKPPNSLSNRGGSDRFLTETSLTDTAEHRFVLPFDPFHTGSRQRGGAKTSAKGCFNDPTPEADSRRSPFADHGRGYFGLDDRLTLNQNGNTLAAV